MKKRLLAAALVLVMAFLLLPVSALASDMRELTIVFQTADVRDAGTGADVWVEIEYEDGSYWGTTRDETPYLDHDGTDFDRGAADKYSFSIPDKTVSYYKIVKSGGNDWLLDYVVIDGVKYDAPKYWLEGTTSFIIRPEIGGEKLKDLTVVFYTADEADVGHSGNVWIEIDYADGTHWGSTRSETPYLNHEGTDFDRGAADKYSFSIPDKPVKSYKIVKDGGNWWKLDEVEIDGVLYAGPNRWIYENDSYTIEVGKTPQAQHISLTVETGNWDGGGTDRSIYVSFYVQDPLNSAIVNKSAEYDLDNPGDDFVAGEKGTYELRGIPAGKILYCDFRFYEDGIHDHWDLESVSINGGAPVTARHTFTFHGEKYRVFFDAEAIEKDVDIYTGDDGTDAYVYVKFSFADGTETLYINLDKPGNDFEANSHSIYELYLPDKDITEITFQSSGTDSWELASFIFDSVYYTVNQTLSDSKPYHVPYEFSDAEIIEKSIEIYTGNNGTDNDVRVKFIFTDGSETSFINLDKPGNDFEANTYQLFEVKIPNKTVKTIIIGLFDSVMITDTWELNYFIFGDVRYTSTKKTFNVGEEESFAYKAPNTGSTFSDVNTGLIIGIGVPVIVIAAAAVIVVLRKKKKNIADTAE